MFTKNLVHIYIIKISYILYIVRKFILRKYKIFIHELFKN